MMAVRLVVPREKRYAIDWNRQQLFSHSATAE